jgi:hypothetical protein
MNVAPSYVAAFVGIVAAIFPDIDLESLNVTVNTLVLIASSLMIMYRQVKTGRSTVAGTRPE